MRSIDRPNPARGHPDTIRVLFLRLQRGIMLQRLDTTARPARPADEPSRTAPTHPSPMPQRPRLELSFPKVIAGALAAASAAVAASWLGVAGTVVGAVIASVVVSVTSALYSHPLERGSQVIREVIPPVVPTRYRASDATGGTETLVVDAAEPEQPTVESVPAEPPQRRIRWSAVALSSIAMLVVGFAIITGVEALVGKPVTAVGGDGGTTLSHIVHRSGNSSPTPSNGGQNGSDSTGSPSTGPTEAPTTDAPTTDAPTTGGPTTAEPTEPTSPTGTGPTTAPASGAASGAADRATDAPQTAAP